MSFSTILSRSSAALLSYISRLPKSPERNILFTLSVNTPLSALSPLTSALAKSSENTVGCLSAPLPDYTEDVIACSLAVFDKRTSSLFRSTIKGREEVGVGRARRRKPNTPSLRNNDAELGGRPRLAHPDWVAIWGTHGIDDRLPGELQASR